jgi:hypothetical protein
VSYATTCDPFTWLTAGVNCSQTLYYLEILNDILKEEYDQMLMTLIKAPLSMKFITHQAMKVSGHVYVWKGCSALHLSTIF